MNVQESYTILLNGDEVLMKDFLIRNAGTDLNLAQSIANSLRRELKKAKLLGLILTVLGIPLSAILLGIPVLIVGVWRLMQYKRGSRVLNEGLELYRSDMKSTNSSAIGA